MVVHSEPCQDLKLRNRVVPTMPKLVRERKNSNKDNEEVVVEKEVEKESEVKEKFGEETHDERAEEDVRGYTID